MGFWVVFGKSDTKVKILYMGRKQGGVVSKKGVKRLYFERDFLWSDYNFDHESTFKVSVTFSRLRVRGGVSKDRALIFWSWVNFLKPKVGFYRYWFWSRRPLFHNLAVTLLSRLFDDRGHTFYQTPTKNQPQKGSVIHFKKSKLTPFQKNQEKQKPLHFHYTSY